MNFFENVYFLEYTFSKIISGVSRILYIFSEKNHLRIVLGCQENNVVFSRKFF